MRNNVLSILICLLFVQSYHDNISKACTVFYMYKSGVILGGSNEDCSDPYTKMSFFPSEGDNEAWVKFSFGGGFPQAGMNGNGMFWDGTSGPYLDMPYSEANKILYDGPLMEKVIVECKNTDEAIHVFKQYYCEDQYRAQYLLGDSLGYSIIVEGDSILRNDHGQQVLTNFYQSQPDLGGHPCWRYDIAMEMLQNCGELTPYYAGSILSATHQEGNYPTQYSVIFEPKTTSFFLFNRHNYDEFLHISLWDELENGEQSYNISYLFSRLKLHSPENGATISADSVVLEWEALPGNEYEIFISESPDFKRIIHRNSYVSECIAGHSMANAFAYLLFLPACIFCIKKKKGALLILFFIMLTFNACKKEEVPEDYNPVRTMSEVVHQLEPSKTYFWKILATPATSDHFKTESIVYSFSTAAR